MTTTRTKGTYLRRKYDSLVFEVVNKAQNRIIDMDRKGVDWQKSKLEAISEDYSSSGPLQVNQLKLVPSGRLVPVLLRCAE